MICVIIRFIYSTSSNILRQQTFCFKHVPYLKVFLLFNIFFASILFLLFVLYSANSNILRQQTFCFKHLPCLKVPFLLNIFFASILFLLFLLYYANSNILRQKTFCFKHLLLARVILSCFACGICTCTSTNTSFVPR